MTVKDDIKVALEEAYSLNMGQNASRAQICNQAAYLAKVPVDWVEAVYDKGKGSNHGSLWNEQSKTR